MGNVGRLCVIPVKADFGRFGGLSRLVGITYHLHDETRLKRKFGKIKERPVVSRAVLLVVRFNPLVLLKCPAGKKTIKK